MKYISLFEKFESIKLSKVIRYISKLSRKSFLSDIKKISTSKDIEPSKISDDMFTYLPYRDAIKIKSKLDKLQCPLCLGEGKIKKPWGTEGKKGFHYRYLDCKECGNTGKIESGVGKITDIKFWFNSDGEYLGRTCINGIEKKSDRRFDSVNEIKTLTLEEIMALETGTLVKINIGYEVIGTIFKDTIKTYVIQNTRHSSTPNLSSWKKYGTHAWRIDNGDFRNAILVSEKGEGDSDPFSWNFDVQLDGSRITTGNNPVKDLVSNADFSLILNLNNLDSLKKSPRSAISQERKIRKGVTKTDEEIKNENIQRYISNLALNFKITTDIGDVSKIVPRMLGWSNSIIFICRETNFTNMERIIDAYFGLFKIINNLKEKEDIDYQISRHESTIKQYLSSGYERSSTEFPLVSKALKVLESSEKKETIEFTSLLKELGSSINEKILKTKVETLGDLEQIMFKINNIRWMMASHRYSFRDFDSLIRRMTTQPKDLKYSLDSHPTYTINMIKDLKSIIGIVNKM